MVLTDSHCHLTATQFDPDRIEVIERAREAGVTRMITIASDAEDARTALRLAHAHSSVWSTAGIHPHEVGGAEDSDVRLLEELFGDERVVAVGETGLDYHYDHAPRPRQRAFLDRHGELASDHRLPLVVHSRKADDDLAAFLRALPASVSGVLHCFTGGRALFDTGLERGWYFGFGGIATFKSFENEDLLRAVPADRLLIETDAPYLAPVPVRGKRNEPAFITHSAEKIAALRGSNREQLALSTALNAARLFGLPDPTPEA